MGREAEGASGGVACSLQPHCGDAPRSLLAIHPFCLYARAMPVLQQSPKAKREPSGSRGRLWAFVVFVALLALVFLRPLAGLVVYAADSKLNSHVILIPFVSIYLVYINRRQLPETYTFKGGRALLFLLVGR